MPDLRSVLEKRAGRGRSVDPTEALRRVRERLDAPWAESLGSRRRSWGATIALVGVTCLVVVVVGTGLVIARHHDRLSTGSSPTPRSKPGPPSGWHRHQDGPAGFRIDYPGSWHRAAASLTPNLGDPTQLTAVGSYPLPVGGPNCAQEPVAALNGLGPGDGFVWVSELAVVPSAQYTSPDWNPRIPFAGGGAQVSADGRTLNLTVIGAAAGTGPCTADYAATATESSNAVAVEVHETLHMTSAPVACEQVGYPRQITVRLVAPLGPRVLVDTKARAPIVAQP